MKPSKFILPILLLALIVLVYITYFSPTGALGSFDDFDPNNNANKEIRVKVVETRGFQVDPSSGGFIFYAEDRHGQQVMIQGPSDISEDVRKSEVVVLTGHLHKGYFHAAGVKAD